MKRIPGRRNWRFSAAFIWFLVIAVIMYAVILAYEFVDGLIKNEIIVAALMVAVVFVLASICAFVDVFRRKVIIDRPVNDILEAANRMAAGDFSVRLSIDRENNKYNEFDLICENLNILAEELSKDEVLKNDFISNVSHEIKTPLSVIQNYATILQDSNLDEESRKKYSSVILSAAKRLSMLVTNVLKLNKLENQKLDPEIETVNLTEVLTESVLLFEEQIEQKEIILDCDFDDVIIESSRSNLEIVFSNLISNAVKFTENGGRIGVSLKKSGDYCIIEISDTGCGISPEAGKRIFEKFYQADTSHSGEGNGLGLALVKRVIDILGSEISIKSEIGKGSTFAVRLRGGSLENK